MIRTKCAPCVAAAAALALAGCGRHSTSDVATVASGKNFEVTVPEFEQVLKNAPPVARQDVVPARKAFLNTLINQKLLADAGLKAGLDRQPDVMQAIEAARREIIAQAYVRQLTTSSASPSNSAISSYYEAHPAWFAARKRVDIEQVAVPAANPAMKRYADAFGSGGLDALKSALADDGVPATSQVVSVGGDQLPGGAQAKSLSAGESITYRSGPFAVFGRVQNVVPEPMSLDQARDAVVAHIQAEQRQSLIKAELDRLRNEQAIHIDMSKLGATPKSAQ